MQRFNQETTWAKRAVLCLSWLLAGGCATLDSPVKKGALPSENSATGSAVAKQEPSTAVAAVEDFLRRTNEYAISTTAALSSPSSMPAGESRKREPSSGEAGVGPDANGDAKSSAASLVAEPLVANAKIDITDRAVPVRPAPAAPILKSLRVEVPKLDSGTDVAVSATRPAENVSAVNHPLDTMPAVNSLTVEEWLRLLEDRVAKGDDFDAEWQLRFARVGLRRDESVQTWSASLSEETRSLLTALFDVIAAVRVVARTSVPVSEEALSRVEQLRQKMADRANPLIADIRLCKKVVTFGVYDEMPAEELAAGQGIQTIVYCEVRNLRYEKTSEGHYRASLATRVELIASDGRSVWNRDEPSVTDVCRKPRGDFFLAQRVSLPATLPEGEYVLKAFVEDKLSGKATEGTHRFLVGAGTSLAKARER